MPPAALITTTGAQHGRQPGQCLKNTTDFPDFFLFLFQSGRALKFSHRHCCDFYHVVSQSDQMIRDFVPSHPKIACVAHVFIPGLMVEGYRCNTVAAEVYRHTYTWTIVTPFRGGIGLLAQHKIRDYSVSSSFVVRIP